LEISHLAEVAVLSESLNEMAAQLDERLRLVTKERNQQEAVLSSMVEGVLAVDNQGRIMTFNQAATRLTGINFEQAPNQTLGAVAPNTPLAQFVAQILNSAKPKESEFGNLSQGGRILQVHGSILRDAHGKGIGAVVVLNDVTRLSRLEQVRRDFVANVSHELRTPITSIKGFVETLLDGALNNPEDARRFLEIVAKQSDRLNAILGDLLTLSRIEEGEEKANIETEVMAIRETLDAALQLCLKKASAKNIQVQLKCEENVQARINPSLLEQAISNLIDNAIKYSPAGSNVMIYAEHQHNEVMICVEDHGCGIAAEHLPRLFERFYRVDKARSRALGGTGLGLSIVNHIITAHGGRVTVESVLGTGSTFCVYLPAA
jgi:two-component system phosphate regulon sensor histidine kinase PhoR